MVYIISETPKKYKSEKIEKSERSQIIKEIYCLYDTKQESNHRKKENWKRYIAWLKEIRKPDSKENQLKFQKNKRFIKWISIERFCYFTSHVPTNDLYGLKGIVLDRINRGKSIGSYIMSLKNIK